MKIEQRWNFCRQSAARIFDGRRQRTAETRRRYSVAARKSGMSQNGDLFRPNDCPAAAVWLIMEAHGSRTGVAQCISGLVSILRPRGRRPACASIRSAASPFQSSPRESAVAGLLSSAAVLGLVKKYRFTVGLSFACSHQPGGKTACRGAGAAILPARL